MFRSPLRPCFQFVRYAWMEMEGISAPYAPEAKASACDEYVAAKMEEHEGIEDERSGRGYK